MSRPRKRKPSSHEGDALTEVSSDERLSVDDEQVVRAVEEVADAIVARVLAEADEPNAGDAVEGEPDEAEPDEAELDEAEPAAAEPDGAEPEDAGNVDAAEAEDVLEGSELGEADQARELLAEGAVEPTVAEGPADELGYERAAEDEDGTLPGEDTEERPGLEKAPPVSVGDEHLKGVIESLLFVSDKPLSVQRLAKIAHAPGKEIQKLLDVLMEEYRGRGIELVEVAGGFQFRSAAANAPFVRELVARKPVRLTRAQIETLAMIAYRQPITRPEVDEIRGVDSGSALKVLLEKQLVKIIGRKDEPGRPLLYGTTPYFLEFFGLASLSDLPTLKEYSELNEESRALFQRRTGEAIEDIADIEVEKREYTDEELEGVAAEQEPDELAARAAAEQLELGAVATGEPVAEESEQSAADDES